MTYFRIDGALYAPVITGGALMLCKAAVGSTKTQGGITYRLNQNHRWERIKEAPGQMRLFDTPDQPTQPTQQNQQLTLFSDNADNQRKVGADKGAMAVATKKPVGLKHKDSKELSEIVKAADFFGPWSAKYGKMPSYEEYLERQKERGVPNPEELAMLSRYTDLDYKIINNHLNGNKTNVIASLIGRQPTRADLAAMDAAIELISRATQSIQPKFQGAVYRGEPLSNARLSKYQVGKTFTAKAFTSTSVDELTSQAFGALRMVIQSKTGTQVNEHSLLNPEEKEVLFDPGSRFKVQKVERGDNSATVYLQEI
jgi:hypothetical protein